MDVTANINFYLDAKDHIILGAKAKAFGKIKIFADDSDKIMPTGPIDIKLIEANFNSNDIANLLSDFLEDYLGGSLGPVVTGLLKNPDNFSDITDKYFDDLITNSDDKIMDATKKSEKLIGQKQKLLDYNDTLVGDYEKKINKSINEIDKKIEEIDKEINPTLDTLSKIPMIDTMVDLDSYKNKVKKLKKKQKKEKQIFKIKQIS